MPVIIVSKKLKLMMSLNIFKKVEDYFISRLLLIKLESQVLVAKLIVLLLSSFLLISMVFLILFFIGITLSLLIGEWLGDIIYGFAVTSTFYIVVLLVIIVFRKKLIATPIMDIAIKELNKNNDDEEER
ncbi:MAG: hypothetical protein GQ525_02600 [Draconibacterium sp.]|nr:hypothetical protein [Draconibacterium sp.]